MAMKNSENNKQGKKRNDHNERNDNEMIIEEERNANQ